ncbi:MOSC domain-containing protein [Paenibacillus oenotherae]|uniref:MOSC domain-containing protein n=1 Tax=Paenibacillus oenotherae TaxID=1435645 RepID=A0ABS7D465_9BACL|nr:MOSC N-terminal beta barrel domain-containing protein [Paenibacillus oenotherae]MBW7474725.1 MOSC domain-containing protein [Paenibacillus oenotherae]
MQQVGEIMQISRYPVKSFAGESVARIEIANYGIYGDRSHAFVDETVEDDWERFITARRIPEMLGYKAQLMGNGDGSRFPDVKVTSPEGHVFDWDEHLLKEIQAYSAIKLSMIQYEPVSADLLAVDLGSVLIITDSSLRELEKLWGKGLDPRRFRANLIIKIREGMTCREQDFIGKQLHIGRNVVLSVDTACERCSMITFDPESLARDASLLKVVNEKLDLKYGVYASVIKTGEIAAGDQVFLAGLDLG